MTPQLTRRSPEPQTDRIDDQFPYADERDGFGLPRPAARGVLRPSDEDGAIGAAGSLRCPACGGETINGAGLFTCSDCSWSGSLR